MLSKLKLASDPQFASRKSNHRRLARWANRIRRAAASALPLIAAAAVTHSSGELSAQQPYGPAPYYRPTPAYNPAPNSGYYGSYAPVWQDAMQPTLPSAVRQASYPMPALKSGHHLHVHHVVFRGHGGKTNESNLLCVCTRCHSMIHQGLLHVQRDEVGGYRFLGADGLPVECGRAAPHRQGHAHTSAQADQIQQ